MINFNENDHVVIQNRGDGWDGLTGVVEMVDGQDMYYVRYTSEAPVEHLTHGWWSTRYLAKVEAPNPVASLQHQTSLDYARFADSTALTPPVRKILQAAAAGEEIDVVEFRKALTYALSLAATRTSNSSERKIYAQQARHLIHWCDAIIDNHLKGLPVYEGGPRSPRIHELEQERGRLMAQVERLEAQADDLRRAVTNIGREADRARASESIEVQRTAALIREKTELEVKLQDAEAVVVQSSEVLERVNERLGHLYSECNEMHAALEYAFKLLPEADQRRLAGFRDGYAQRVNDES